MKERQLMKGAAFMLLAATATLPAHAQLKTNAGVQYLLSQSKDMSQDFLDLSNTYFFADSLVSFDTSTGKGTVQWKRQQLMPRQAFNANTYLHQPLQSLDFPETAYDNNPQLTFTVEPVSERTLRIRMLTSPIVPKEDADDPMLEEGSGRDVYLPGRQKWIDYQTGKVYAPGWNHIECGTLPIVILVKDGSAIPHIPVAQCTDRMKWDKITWKKYLADEKKAEGLLCLPQDGRLQRMVIP